MRLRSGMPAVAFLAASAVLGRGIGTPSPWRDEAVTLDVARRSPGAILRLAAHDDLVHVLYYLLAHTVTAAGGGLVALRWLSAVAMAGAVALTYAIARRLAGAGAAVTTTGVLLAAAFVSRYGQEARPFALATCATCLSTWLLLRLLRTDAGRRATAVYAASVVLVGLTNLVALLVLMAHAAAVVALAPGRWRRAVAGAGAAGVLLAPFAVVALGQTGQVAWLPRPDAADLFALPARFYTDRVLGAAVPAACVAVLVLARRWRLHGALLVATVWAFGPHLVLWAVSQAHPLWFPRYLLFSAPGGALALALLVEAALDAARRATGALPPAVRAPAAHAVRVVVTVAVVGALAAGALPAQQRVRSATGHDEDLRSVAQALRRTAGPDGAYVLHAWTDRSVATAYPGVVAGLRDLSLCGDGAATTTLYDVRCDRADAAARLAEVDAVVVLTRDGEEPSFWPDLLRENGFRPTASTRSWQYTLERWRRTSTG